MTQRLLKAARQVQKNAHSPYSGFSVGAAILAENNEIYLGCNVENAAYPLGHCAEANAIGAMISQGAKHISEIMILSPTEQICPPCGGCRQKIQEFASPDTAVHMATKDGKITTMTIAQLLPLAFKI